MPLWLEAAATGAWDGTADGRSESDSVDGFAGKVYLRTPLWTDALALADAEAAGAVCVDSLGGEVCSEDLPVGVVGRWEVCRAGSVPYWDAMGFECVP